MEYYVQDHWEYCILRNFKVENGSQEQIYKMYP